MSLRLKLSFMLSTFLVIIAVFAFGTNLIFRKLGDNMSSLQVVSREHGIISELENRISGVIDAANNWGLTGNPLFVRQYQQNLIDTFKSFNKSRTLISRRPELEMIISDFSKIETHSRAVINTRYPSGNPEVLKQLQILNSEGKGIKERLVAMDALSMNTVMEVVARGEKLKKDMVSYLFALIVFSAMTAVILIIRIRRSIAVPFKAMLKATALISGGDLSYRIHMDRGDEFGLLAERFNRMVADLEATSNWVNMKLAETELHLEVARVAGTSLSLKESLPLIADMIASGLHFDNCAIYLLRPELKAFCLEAAGGITAGTHDERYSLADGIGAEMLKQMKPIVIKGFAIRQEEVGLLPDPFHSMVAVPMMRDLLCTGMLIVRNRSPHDFSEDEIKTLTILAHTSASVIKNAELYISKTDQLQKLTALYEISKAITSVLDLEELLKKITVEIKTLLSSRGCIIRLFEDDRLRIKSCSGLPEGVEEEIVLSRGTGIAGWVAENGKSLLVADVSKMPEGIGASKIALSSVVCVPLKIGETVTGTLGLYDKQDADGKLVPFTADDMDTAEGFASVAAIAIDKARLFEKEVTRERETSEAKKRLDILFDSVQGGIMTLDRNFKIISVNKYVQEWAGRPSYELIGKDSMEIFHDKIGICPHCAAKTTFDTGDVNSIVQSRGVNYAELTAYPINNEAGETVECVVFILDITERVLYQEETLSLYREVIQTKEYMESLIDNSADAIVTSDMEGVITSWNDGAEKIYGFTAAEAMGKFLPFVPDPLMEKERDHIENIKKGDVLKNIETFRRRKDGTIIEISLTLSPIKDASGNVIGVSGISRDISEKKIVEKELIRRNQELSRLYFISSTMRGTLELDKLLRMVLIAVTMGDGMGFNRAILFLVDDTRQVLKGEMGVGPSSHEEAHKIWEELSFQKKNLDDIMEDVISGPSRKDSFLDRLSMGLELPIDSDSALGRAVRERRSFNITDAKRDPLADAVLIQQLGTAAYAVVPLISRGNVIGIIWVDNYFNNKPVTDEDMKFLSSFSNHVASAIENARLFEKVRMAEQRLENIFESMSDMVYFNNKDYEILSANKAVGSRLGIPLSEIIGKKCYEIFHGTSEPYAKCPHHKTVETKKAYIEELTDPRTGQIYLTSSSPIFDLTGEFIGSVHVVRDITEHKKLQAKLATAEKMAALGEVAAKVAHEIRNPLVSVGGFAKRLEKKLDGNLKEYATIIVREVDRLESILREILGFVKEVRLSLETVDLNQLITDIAKLMESGMDDKRISLIMDLGPSALVFVDPNRVKEAIMNIVSNALQSLNGSGSVSMRTYLKDRYAVVEIEDTGKGIPEADKAFIFNPFFTTKPSGTGLGLAITHKIIQEHNGNIEVESVPGTGSIFRIYLPLKEGQP